VRSQQSMHSIILLTQYLLFAAAAISIDTFGGDFCFHADHRGSDSLLSDVDNYFDMLVD
jgi:hypothetical protein